jgi:hypothetical protein
MSIIPATPRTGSKDASFFEFQVPGDLPDIDV